MSNQDLYRQAISLVSKMPPATRTKLFEYLKSLELIGPAEAVEAEVDEPLSIMKMYFSKKGVDTPPLSVVKRSNRFPNCQKKINTAWMWCKKLSRNKVERVSIFLLACQCLDDFLTTNGVPTFFDDNPSKPYNRKLKNVGLYDIAMHADFMPTAVDSAFPGYAKQGLLRSVALRHLT